MTKSSRCASMSQHVAFFQVFLWNTSVSPTSLPGEMSWEDPLTHPGGKKPKTASEHALHQFHILYPPYLHYHRIVGSLHAFNIDLWCEIQRIHTPRNNPSQNCTIFDSQAEKRICAGENFGVYWRSRCHHILPEIFPACTKHLSYGSTACIWP